MNSKKLFQSAGYCIIESAIDNKLRDFITQYALFDEMQNYSPGDEQSPDAHSRYADPAMETLLLDLQKVIEDVTDLSLYPTYSYYRVYRDGDILEEHTDRPSCEISATLCFNYNYDESLCTWPIFMDGNKIILQPGDMVIYRGCDLPHWREKFVSSNPEHWQVQGFFHYVDVNGKFKEYKFDKRESVGMSKVQTQPTKSYITFTK